ncbi:MAG: hypothetical protein HY589_05635 [Candidatus Omnitrophica bacterium]|nr:hypothetical protein [Candidatus Omnitrophota bacterium]
MRKCLFVVCGAIFILTSAGCVRTHVVTKERVDIDVAGNQGVIYGAPPAAHKVQNPTRDIYAIDVELPTAEEIKASGKKRPGAERGVEDKAVTGNAGVVSGAYSGETK